MEELRLSFLVFGACAIAGILVHGLWSVRKNAAKKDKQTLERKGWQGDIDSDDVDNEDTDTRRHNRTFESDDYDSATDFTDPLVASQEYPEHGYEDAITASDHDTAEPSFDEFGLGEVRVVGKNTESIRERGQDKYTASSAEAGAAHLSEPEPAEEAGDNAINTQDDKPKDSPKIYASVVTQPKPEFTATLKHGADSAKESSSNVPEPPLSLLKQESERVPEPAPGSNGVAVEPVKAEAEIKIDRYAVPDINDPAEPEKPSFAEQAKNLVRRKKAAETSKRKRKEPRLDPHVREDQMAIDFDEPAQPQVSETDIKHNTSAASEKVRTTQVNAPELQQEVLVLNVKAADDNPIPGAALLPMLLTLGFKFGDQDIFHRHVNSNGKGPVLFSLANMFKPGVFDIDNLENFSTQGVSLFMILPIEGDPHQVFNMMHNAARKLADEFSAQVLDGRRSVLTKQSLQQYVEKIREFERRRMIAR